MLVPSLKTSGGLTAEFRKSLDISFPWKRKVIDNCRCNTTEKIAVDNDIFCQNRYE